MKNKKNKCLSVVNILLNFYNDVEISWNKAINADQHLKYQSNVNAKGRLYKVPRWMVLELQSV